MNSTLVQFDFDNTMTIGNVSEKLHSQFGPSSWNDIFDDYKNKLISVEESNIYSFKNFNVPKLDIDKFISENISFRKGIVDLIKYLKIKKYEIKIVSSGVDFYIKSCLNLKSINLDSRNVICGQSIQTDVGMEVKYLDSKNNEIKNDFKFTYTEQNKKEYNKIIYFGDSFTDIESALISDVIFATDELSDYLKSKNVKHYSFNDFCEVLDIFKSDISL